MGLARIIVPLFPGIHAREWISPAVCTYVIREIVENAATNGYVDQINFHFLPVANPDGYEYTFSTVSCTSSLQLIGVTVNHPFWTEALLELKSTVYSSSSKFTLYIQDRLWRKTRSPQGVCYGVDPNRNFDMHWGGKRGIPNYYLICVTSLRLKTCDSVSLLDI